ncbi:hypothetical protein EDD85DRAFT_957851 [Armillaria nabsnona]|nr:hypothetical protein EDD85DRAFT_957851 [Armillaria nabsnona]
MSNMVVDDNAGDLSVPELQPESDKPIILPPNMKRWLAGPQHQFIKDNFVHDFQRLHRDDPAGTKELSKTAANKLIAQFGWHLPFNTSPQPVQCEEPLSLQDMCLKAAVVAQTAMSLLTWLRLQTKENVTKKKGKGAKDAFSELLHRLAGTSGVSLKGRLPYQAWASELSNSSDLMKAFEDEWVASDQTERSCVGAYLTFFSNKFHDLPEEEQGHWTEHVKVEKETALKRQDELGNMMGQLLPPAKAQAMNYGYNKDVIPQKLSGNVPRYEHCMNTFSDFLTECFDEEDETVRALPIAQASDSSAKKQVVSIHKIDTEAHQVFNSKHLEAGEVGEDAEEEVEEVEPAVSKKQKKRTLKRKGKEDGDGEGRKKGTKKRKTSSGAETLALTSSDRGRRSKKIGLKTGMDTHAALNQITNMLDRMRPTTTAEELPAAPSSQDPATPSSQDPIPIDPVLLAASQEAETLRQGVIERMHAQASDGMWLHLGIPITGPNNTPDPFTAPHLVLQHPLMHAPIPPPTSEPGSPVWVDEAQDDSSIQRDLKVMDTATWPDWFCNSRKYLDSFELGEDWAYLLVCYMLWEGRKDFQENSSSFPTFGSCPEQVAYWSKHHWNPFIELNHAELHTFEVKWWSWWRKLQPSWRGISEGEGPFDGGQDGPIGDWEKLVCPGQNGFYSVLACLAWWRRGIDNLNMNKGRLEADWLLALKDVMWVISSMVDGVEGVVDSDNVVDS